MTEALQNSPTDPDAVLVRVTKRDFTEHKKTFKAKSDENDDAIMSEFKQRRTASSKVLHIDSTIAKKHKFLNRVSLILLIFFISALFVLCLCKIFFDQFEFYPMVPENHPPYEVITFFCLTLVFVCILSFGPESWRRNSPTNVILMSLFVLFATLMIGFIGAYIRLTHLIFIYFFSIIAIELVVVSLFTMQSGIDILSCWGLTICSFLIAGLIAGLTAFIVLTYEHEMIELAYLVIPSAFAVFYTFILVWDTRLFILGIWPIYSNEYLFAAITLFINMFLFVFLINRFLIPWRHTNSVAKYNKIPKRKSLSSIQVFRDHHVLQQ